MSLSPLVPTIGTEPPLPPTTLAAEPAPTLRRLPARELEPPYDDECEPRWRDGAVEVGPPAPPAGETSGSGGVLAGVQGALALAFAVPGHRWRPGRTPLTLVPALPPAAGNDDRDDEAVFGPQPTPRSCLPAPAPWAGRLVQALLEVLAGQRPVSQVLRWTSAAVYADLEDDLTRRLGRQPRRAGVRRTGGVVRSVHVGEPREGVAEVCAVVLRGARYGAIALRLEGVDGRWQCTALQVG